MPLSPNHFYKIVRSHADAMLESGRGTVDGEVTPLFGGVIDVGLRQVITFLTPPPPCIRITDFNWCGNNLTHDLPLLEVLNTLGDVSGEKHYNAAVEDVFKYYGAHCPHPVTGLFPWGEHAQWSFGDKSILPCSFSNGLSNYRDQNLVHDHLAFAPGWFWQGLWNHHPDVVTKFAHGLDGHIVNAETFEHNRHGQLSQGWWHDKHNPGTGQGKDFARHAGFFIFDTLFAYARSGDESLLEWARRKTKYHMDRRLPNGIIHGCVRSKEEQEEGQHDSFVLSIADAADVLGDTPEGHEFRAYAEELFDARRKMLQSEPIPLPEEPGDGRLWLDGYIRKAPIKLRAGNMQAQMYARTGIPWYADTIIETARWLQTNLQEPPAHMPVIARRFWFHLEAMLAAHALTGDSSFLESAAQIGAWVEKDLVRNGMLLGCSNITCVRLNGNYETHIDPWTEPNSPGFYYSVSGTNNLLRSLLRLALLQEGQPDPLGPDPYRRQ